jgi:GMP synthase (glutamine-hydrolysing)
MKPVLILQHLSGDGPAYLGTWLAQHGVAARVFNTQAGDAFPASLQPYGALAILGGEMSANDSLPSLRDAQALFLQALRMGVPTLGHCLGGQLMARALGAQVHACPAPEIGWQRVEILNHPTAHDWLGGAEELWVFQWHRECFDLPAGAQLLASSAACAHQAFALGPHLAMQFHVEVDDEKLGRWAQDESEAHLLAAAVHRSLQDGAAMRMGAGHHLPAQQRLADRIYRRWLAAAGGS